MDIPFVLVFTAHPALEVFFVSVWSMFRAGAVRFRVEGGGLLPENQERVGKTDQKRTGQIFF